MLSLNLISFLLYQITDDPEGNLISMAEMDAEKANNKFHIIMGFAPE